MHRVGRSLVIALGGLLAACGGGQRARTEASPVRDTREGDDFEYREGAVPAGPAAEASDDDDDKSEETEVDDSDDDAGDESKKAAGKVDIEVDAVEIDASDDDDDG